jgi:hypothetical protein
VGGGWGTALLETDGHAGGQVEGHGSDGIRSSCYTLRNSRPPINPFYFGSRAARNPPSRGGLGVWKRRPPRWLCVGDLRGDSCGGGTRGCKQGADGFVGICGLAGGRRGAEGTVRDQPFPAESALAERVGENGDFTRFCLEPGEERPPDELGCEVGVQALLSAPEDARLLPISLWWSLLQMHRVALWLGKIGFMVHKADATRCQAHKKRAGVPRAPLDRRLSVRAHRRSSSCHWTRLSAGLAFDWTRSSGSWDSLGIQKRDVGKGHRCWSISACS